MAPGKVGALFSTLVLRPFLWLQPGNQFTLFSGGREIVCRHRTSRGDLNQVDTARASDKREHCTLVCTGTLNGAIISRTDGNGRGGEELLGECHPVASHFACLTAA